MNEHIPARQSNGGAPAGNGNAMRHGPRGSKLPRVCRHIENRGHELRRQLESACVYRFDCIAVAGNHQLRSKPAPTW